MAPGDRAGSRILHRYLLDDEQVVVATRHHWAKLLEPAATTVAAFLLVAWASGPLERLVGETALLVWWLWLAVLGRLVWKALEWRNEWFVATDRRLLMTYGLVTYKVAMMPLRKVTDMNYARSPFGRVMGYGQFLLESAGQDQAMREIDWLPDPDRAYRRICDTIFGPGVRDPDDALHDEPELAAAPDTSPWSAAADADGWDTSEAEHEQQQDPGEDEPWFDEPQGEPRFDEPAASSVATPAAGRYSPPDVGWEVSTEDADQYVPVRVVPRRRRGGGTEEVAPAAGRDRSGFDLAGEARPGAAGRSGEDPGAGPDDPDATGPIPRPGRARPGPSGTT